ncbi:hypothetical protein CABS01_03915 [Colletotrichum abscissum]|uniref:uncharacterized protein n=1 Tax=Colletotrichum abscissum TaxID=1671311 RepID=UPI0027D6AF2F|nr:uncharacterized protein CABS01_03915 [Colletotrichum abscissum]KAK1475638.1 hypothetical protein CABS01_03915 [Colletotrichum abscissum]
MFPDALANLTSTTTVYGCSLNSSRPVIDWTSESFAKSSQFSIRQPDGMYSASCESTGQEVESKVMVVRGNDGNDNFSGLDFILLGQFMRYLILASDFHVLSFRVLRFLVLGLHVPSLRILSLRVLSLSVLGHLNISLSALGRLNISLRILSLPSKAATCNDVPPEKEVDVVAWDDTNTDLNILCKFACKYGHCPQDICTSRIDGPDTSDIDIVVTDPEDPLNYIRRVKQSNSKNCNIYKEPQHWDYQKKSCDSICKPETDQAKKEGKMSNAFCLGFWPIDKPIPWQKIGPDTTIAGGKCECNNPLVNEFADIVLDGMPQMAQVSVTTP